MLSRTPTGEVPHETIWAEPIWLPEPWRPMPGCPGWGWPPGVCCGTMYCLMVGSGCHVPARAVAVTDLRARPEPFLTGGPGVRPQRLLGDLPCAGWCLVFLWKSVCPARWRPPPGPPAPPGYPRDRRALGLPQLGALQPGLSARFGVARSEFRRHSADGSRSRIGMAGAGPRFASRTCAAGRLP
jgi:hypothetical protein